MREFIQAFRNAFPDLNLQIDDFFTSNDRACTAFTLKGTHEQDFMGIPATKKFVEVQWMVISRIKSLYEDGESKRKFALLRQVFRFFKANSGLFNEKKRKTGPKRRVCSRLSRFRIGSKDNKILEDREILDNLTFFQQLGVVPEMS